MNAENQKPDDTVSQDVNSKVDTSRRSFAKKSAAVAPVIMTLANRSAWGGTNMCTQSGFASFAAVGWVQSHVVHGSAGAQSGWKNPTEWANSASWPSVYGQATLKNNGKFESPLWLNNGGQLVQKTLLEVKNYETTNNIIFLARTLVPNTITNPDSTLTLLAALTGSDLLLSYRVATALNHVVSTMPTPLLQDPLSFPLDSNRFTDYLSVFQTFYTSCGI